MTVVYSATATSRVMWSLNISIGITRPMRQFANLPWRKQLKSVRLGAEALLCHTGVPCAQPQRRWSSTAHVGKRLA